MLQIKRLGIALLLVMGFMMAATSMAQTRQNVGQMVSGLVALAAAVQVGDIEIGDITVVDIGDVDITLRDIDIRILETVVVRNVRINALNNLLREANILTDSQIVVAVLSGPVLVVRDLAE